MTSETRRKIQLVLAVVIAAAALRAGYVVYERRASSAKETRQQAPPLNPDYYVSPKKLYPYDLKSAKQLTQQPVWVKEGYRYTYYRYDPARQRVDFAHEAGLLGPIERLAIHDVITANSPAAGQKRQVMAAF